MSALVNRDDIDLLLLICQLPPQAKTLINKLVQMHLTALEGGRKAFSERETQSGVAPFTEKNNKPVGEKSIAENSDIPKRKRAAPRTKTA
jgi:hypothetical protein